MYIEKDCTFEHNGQKFTSGGAVITPEHAIGYPAIEREYIGAAGTINDWHGAKLGTCRVVGRWATPRSFMAAHMLQIEATIAGVKYTGRGCGNGMIWSGKRKARQ